MNGSLRGALITLSSVLLVLGAVSPTKATASSSSGLVCGKDEVAEGVLAKSQGCVAADTLTADIVTGAGAALITFQKLQGNQEDETTGGKPGQRKVLVQDPVTCFRTCQLVFPDRHLALINWQPEVITDNSTGHLECYCTDGSVLTPPQLGPDYFCDRRCNGLPCGGNYIFSNGKQADYLSLYCLGKPRALFKTFKTAVTKERKRVKRSVESFKEVKMDNSTLTKEELQKTLDQIWVTLAHTNIVAIVTVALLVVIIILVLVLLVWLYSFMETFNATNRAQPAFYRTEGIAGTPNPQGANSSKPRGAQAVDTYGATNMAYDPSPNSDPVFGNNLDGQSADDARSFGGSTFFRSESEEGHDRGTSSGVLRSEGIPRLSPDEDDSGSHISTETEMADDFPGNGRGGTH